jgi:hypothetical protein
MVISGGRANDGVACHGTKAGLGAVVGRMSIVVSRAFLLVLPVVLFAAGATPFGSTALASAAVPPATCTPTPVNTPMANFVDVGEQSSFQYDVPVSTTSVSGSATVSGFPTWLLNMTDATSASVPDPTFTINSGLDPSVFDGGLPGSSQTFPASCNLPTLAPNQAMSLGLAAPGIQVMFSPGFDSSISMSPSTVPVGGSDVTVQVTVMDTNPDLAYMPSSDVSPGGMLVNVPATIDPSSGVTIVSLSSPTNLTSGQKVTTCTTNPCPPGQPPTTWALTDPQLNTQYVFTAVLHVANPPPLAVGETGQTWAWSPGIDIAVSTPFTHGCSSGCPGASVGVPVPSLDGSTPGSGQVTFSTGASGKSENWSVADATNNNVDYPPSPYPPPLPLGVSSSALGSPTSATTYMDNATTLIDPTRTVSARTSIPANALPSDTAVREYPVRKTRALAASIPKRHSYIVAFAVSWIAKTGTSPRASTPITMKIVDRKIAAGDAIYRVVSKRLARVGTTKANGTARITFTTDSTFIVATPSKSKHR